MQIRVLGPVDVVDDAGGNVALRGPMPARLLALLVAAGRSPVSVDDLVIELWTTSERPADPVAAIRTYVARLRSSLGAGAVVTGTGAYLLGPVDTDAARFEDLVERARRSSGSPLVADIWRQALDLWRGHAFGDYADSDLIRPAADRLDELRAEATEAWFDARLAAGEGRELAADVDRAVAEFPLREGFRVQQMTVLSRAGRPAEALRAFQEFRGDLTEIGLEPSARLVELDQQIAAGETLRIGARRTLRGYELGERLGEGAFAVVYAAKQASVDRDVAIKQIRGSLADQPEFIRQFEAEAHLVARLEHPHIVPLYDFWREPGSAYLVMRYLDGGSLGGRLLTHPLSVDEVVSVVGQVASALDEAHRSGVIHRDVKPANILLDRSGNAYLSDFGIAVDEAERLDPEAWLSNGSPAYAPPEQLERRQVGSVADVYALGVTTYEVLTGRLPFPAETTMAGLLERQLNDPIPLVRTSHPEVPAAIDTVIQRATAKRPEDRYDSAGAFARDLAAAAGLEGDAVLIHVEDRNPYKGLRAFDEADAGDFSGRDRLTSRLLAAVGAARVVLVVGPSGSGKSSSVRAGLLPAIRQGLLPRSERWFVTAMVPGVSPFADLEAALLRVAVDPPADLLDQLRADKSGLARMLRRVVPDDRELVLLVDQFEELFTLSPVVERTRFLEALLTAATDDRSRLRVVATLRADFYDQPLRHPAFATLAQDSTVAVHPLEPDELERAITEPAASVGARFEPRLVAQITADIADQPGALPLLQYTLTELFEQREGEVLTRAAYERLGGVTGALGRRAEELFVALSEPEQQALQRAMTRLVHLGDGTEDTRRRVRRSELAADDATVAALTRFGDARLLSFDRDPATRESTVEVAHEALIRAWPRLRSWLDDDRDGLRILRHLTEAAKGWAAGGRQPGELYRGGRLEAAAAWAHDHGDQLNPTEADFVAAGVDRERAEAEDEQRSTRRLRRLLAGVAVVAVVALVAGTLAFQQRGEANDNAATAETRRLVADAAVIIDENVDIGLLLAAEAHRRDPSPATLAGLQRVLTRTGSYLGRLGAGSAYLGVEWTDVGIVGIGEQRIDVFDPATLEPVRSIDLPRPVSATHLAGGVVHAMEGSRLVVPLDDSAVVVVTLDTGDVSLIQHDQPVTAVAINETADLVAVGDTERRLAVYDAATGDQRWATLGFPETSFEDVDFGGFDFFASASARVYNQDEFVATLFGGVYGVTFLDNGEIVAGGAATMRAFDTFDGRPLRSSVPLTEDPSFGTAPAFSGRLSFVDGVILSRGVGSIQRFDRDLDLVELSRFDRDRMDTNILAADVRQLPGGRAVAVLTDGRLTFGFLGDTEPTRFVATRANGPTGLALSPDRSLAVTSSADGLVLTSILGDQLLAEAVDRSGRPQFTISPDGRHVTLSEFSSGTPAVVVSLDDGARIEFPVGPDEFNATAGYLSASYLWRSTDVDAFLVDTRTFDDLMELPPVGFGELITPDGQTLIIGSANAGGATLTFIDLQTLAIVGDLDLSEYSAGEGLQMSTASPDSRRIISTYGSGRAVEIDPVTRTVTRVLGVEGGTVAMAAAKFSPDGRLLATRDPEGQINILDGDTYELLYSIEGGNAAFENFSYGPYFSPDSRYLLTTKERRPRLWDLETRTDLGTFPTDDGTVPEGSTGPESLNLVTGFGDHALIWNLNTDQWFDIACRAAGRNLTRAEWEQFGPADQPYQATCERWPVET